jgi:three-Cys-motif partner protein
VNGVAPIAGKSESTGAALTPKTTTWTLEPHTQAKHEILRRYLGGWFPIMSRWNNRIVFFDGFAGPGVYEDGSPGSPIIALKTLLDQRQIRPECEFVFIFNESELNRYASLVHVLENFESENPYPANVKVFVDNTSFELLTSEITDHFTASNGRLAPTFAFVDPFGISGMSMESLRSLLSFNKCEVLAYLDIRSLTRFSTAGNVDHKIESLMGTTDFRNAPAAGTPARIDYLRDLYVKQLKESCDFRYTWTFLMRNNRRQPLYYLVFATNSLKGLEHMKDAMWKLAPDGTYSFSAKDSDALVLFQPTPDLAALGKALQNHFRGKTVSILALENHVVEHTDFLETHLRAALRIMETQGALNVVTINSKRRNGTFPSGTSITFPA